MQLNRQFCFTHSTGDDIYLFTLKNSSGTEALISNYGGIITSFRVKMPDGTYNDIVLGFDRMEDYVDPFYLENYPWMGCAIGRTANRIKDGLLNIEGKQYQLALNKGSAHLHGGKSGFDKKVWEVASFTTNSLELKYTSADGEEGYPGKLDLLLKFELSDDNELSYTFRATAEQTTVINLTHHSYFNLDNGKGTVDNHRIKINASSILEQDETLVANGMLIPVADSTFDFREFKQIGKRWEDKEIYDQSFVVNRHSSNLELVAEAISDLSGTKLEVYSTEPIVHFYPGRWIPEIKGKGGTMYRQCSGFCLETHIHPNAINIPHFPNTILKPGDQYYQKTSYRVSFLK